MVNPILRTKRRMAGFIAKWRNKGNNYCLKEDGGQIILPKGGSMAEIIAGWVRFYTTSKVYKKFMQWCHKFYFLCFAR